jgi:hypothetical protein
MGRIAAFMGESEIAPPSTTPHGRLHSKPGVVDTCQRGIALTNVHRHAHYLPRATDVERNEKAEMPTSEGEA